MSRSEVIMIESWRALICMTFLDYKHKFILCYHIIYSLDLNYQLLQKHMQAYTNSFSGTSLDLTCRGRKYDRGISDLQNNGSIQNMHVCHITLIQRCALHCGCLVHCHWCTV